MDNETNVADKQWFTNKQVVGFFGFFIAMGIGYSNFQTLLKDVEILKLEKEVMKAEHRQEESEMKALILLQKKSINDRQDRMMSPVRNDIGEFKAWMNYEKGLKAARR